jgi:hypothetical protein
MSKTKTNWTCRNAAHRRGNGWRAATFAVAALSSLPGSARADERWQEAGSGAVAILPVPAKANFITGGSLVCAEQRWTLRLRTEPRQPSSPVARARLAIDEKLYPVLAEQARTVVTVPVSYEMIESLKAGAWLTVDLGVDEALSASFPLNNSRKIIDATWPRCSPIDMSAYEKIAISESDPALDIAQSLLAKEVKLFRAATTGTPRLAAARLDRGEGREMLFATVCGSSWYYGRSGCTLLGYLRGAPAEEWREVYNSEGFNLYFDPNASNGGWPDLLTLEAIGGLEPMRWTWTGDRYELLDPRFAADEMPGQETP